MRAILSGMALAIGLVPFTASADDLAAKPPCASGSTTAAAATQVSAPGRAFFVAPAGRDDADGSIDRPFATLGRAQRAMAAGTVRVTYVRGGTYVLAAPVALTVADSGTKYLAYTGESPALSGDGGLATLVSLDGAQGVTLGGLDFRGSRGPALSLRASNGNKVLGNAFSGNVAGVLLDGSSGNTVSGNAITDTGTSAVEVRDRSDCNRFEDNRISGTGAVGTSGGGFFLHGVRYNRIANNLVEGTAGMGIGIANWDDGTINIGNTVNRNIVRNANTSPASADSGAIYLLGRSEVDTQAVVANNLIDGTGRGPEAGAHTVGIYLDDLTSGASVQRNIVRNIGTHGIQIHGGADNTVVGNILDLGNDRASAVLFQAAPADTRPSIAMTNNVVTRNVVLSGSLQPFIYEWIDGGGPSIFDNLYFNTTGASMRTSPPTLDRDPAFGDPMFADAAGGDYALRPGSAAALVGFKPIRREGIGPSP